MGKVTRVLGPLCLHRRDGKRLQTGGRRSWRKWVRHDRGERKGMRRNGRCMSGCHGVGLGVAFRMEWRRWRSWGHEL